MMTLQEVSLILAFCLLNLIGSVLKVTFEYANPSFSCSDDRRMMFVFSVFTHNHNRIISPPIDYANWDNHLMAFMKAVELEKSN